MPANPLAGLPNGVSATPNVPVPGVINLAQAKKKRKLTGQQYKDARDFARGVTGYNDKSPIWGKRMNVVLNDIEANLNDASRFLNSGDYMAAETAIEAALKYNQELQKRLATGQLIGAQS